MVRVRVGGHEARPDVPVGCPLDPPRRKHPLGIAVDQQRQHQPRVVLRLAARLRIHPKLPQPNAVNRRHDEMRDIVLGYPILQIGRQQKGLRAVKRNVGRHLWILPYSNLQVNPTGC